MHVDEGSQSAADNLRIGRWGHSQQLRPAHSAENIIGKYSVDYAAVFAAGAQLFRR